MKRTRRRSADRKSIARSRTVLFAFALLSCAACTSRQSSPAADDPSWSVLYDDQTSRGSRTAGNECRVGRDGRQVCGHHCRTGGDGVVRCAATAQGSCSVGSDGKATCRDPLFPGDDMDAGY